MTIEISNARVQALKSAMDNRYKSKSEFNEFIDALTQMLSGSSGQTGYTGKMVYNYLYEEYENEDDQNRAYAVTVDPQLYNSTIHMYVMDLESAHTANGFTIAEYNAKSLAYMQSATYDDGSVTIDNSTLSNDVIDDYVYSWTPTSTYPTCYGVDFVYDENDNTIYYSLDYSMSGNYTFYLLIAWDDNGNPLEIEYTATDSLHMTATIKPHTT